MTKTLTLTLLMTLTLLLLLLRFGARPCVERENRSNLLRCVTLVRVS